MNCCRETVEMGVPARHASKARRAGHLATAGGWFRGIPERYVAGADTRERQKGQPYPWLQQVIREISGLSHHVSANLGTILDTIYSPRGRSQPWCA